MSNENRVNRNKFGFIDLIPIFVTANSLIVNISFLVSSNMFSRFEDLSFSIIKLSMCALGTPPFYEIILMKKNIYRYERFIFLIEKKNTLIK